MAGEQDVNAIANAWLRRPRRRALFGTPADVAPEVEDTLGPNVPDQRAVRAEGKADGGVGLMPLSADPEDMNVWLRERKVGR